MWWTAHGVNTVNRNREKTLDALVAVPHAAECTGSGALDEDGGTLQALPPAMRTPWLLRLVGQLFECITE
jgi:hypothetical protein